jgi:hypothetical protein
LAGTSDPWTRATQREDRQLARIGSWLPPGHSWSTEPASGVVAAFTEEIRREGARRRELPGWLWNEWQGALTRLAIRRRFGATWRGVFVEADPTGAELRRYEAERAAHEREGSLSAAGRLVQEVARGAVVPGGRARRRGRWTSALVQALLRATTTPQALRDALTVLVQAPLRGLEIEATTRAAVTFHDADWASIAYVPQKGVRRRAFVRHMVVTTTPSLPWSPYDSLARLVRAAPDSSSPLFPAVNAASVAEAIQAVASAPEEGGGTEEERAEWAGATFAVRDLRQVLHSEAVDGTAIMGVQLGHARDERAATRRLGATSRQLATEGAVAEAYSLPYMTE